MAKVLAIVGPTASGKTSLALRLARQLSNSCILACDSRQVYKYMDIITGKDVPDGFHFQTQIDTSSNIDFGYYTDGKLQLYGLDLVPPHFNFTVKHYVEYAYKILTDCFNNQQTPIIVAGTGFFLNSLISPPETLMIPPDPELRQALSLKTTAQLFDHLQRIDPDKAHKLNDSDKANPYRLIRAIEIANYRLDEHQQSTTPHFSLLKPEFSTLIVGLKPASQQILYNRIDQRVDQRLTQGAIHEIESLRDKNWLQYAPAQTLGYKQLIPFLQQKISLETAVINWKHAEHAYARRQLTWFKKMSQVRWFDIQDSQKELQIQQLFATL